MNAAPLHSRVMCPKLTSKIMSGREAAALIPSGARVGMSGFTGSGYPKEVPLELAHRIEAAHAAAGPFKISLWAMSTFWFQ